MDNNPIPTNPGPSTPAPTISLGGPTQGADYVSPKKNKGNKVIGFVLLLVIVALAGFYGGMTYQKHHDNSSPHGSFSGSSQFGGNHMGGFGTVTAVSSSSVTVKDSRTGTSTTYTINGSTSITDNGSTATASSIQTGDTVIVRTSASGSTTATAIMVNPSFGGPSSQSSTSG